MGRVTLQTVADKVGVSRMTVSNAFSKPDQLSTELRDRILAAADQLGYCGPDPAARVLARGTTGAVGVLLTDSLSYAFADEFASAFFGAIAEELATTGLALTLLTSSGVTGTVPARDVPMDGAIVYSCDEKSDAVTWLKRRKFPLVFVDQSPTPGFASINVDDRNGARLAAQHLIDLGHRRVGIVTFDHNGATGILDDPLDSTVGHTSRQRLLGWLDALSGASIRPTVLQGTHSGEEAGRESVKVLLGRPNPPTAILCFSDATAYGVVEGALELGLSIPGDLSVVGFDDTALAKRMHPGLTTIHQNAGEKGRSAASALVDAIQRERSGKAQRIRHAILPTELIVRGSTARPPRNRR